MFTVVYSDVFYDWYDQLTRDEQLSVLAMIKLLKEYGHQLGRPYADSIQGSKLSNLKELRIQHSGKPYREFFAFDPLRQAVILCAGDKTGDKRFYKRMIPLAESIYSEYLNNMEADR